jgi:hypothetical protein
VTENRRRISAQDGVVTGYPTDGTEDAVRANIVAAGYGK